MSKNPAQYYGPFFWLSIVSFCVPVFVAAKAFNEIKVTTKPTPAPDVSGVDHNLWDYLLKSYVENGLVDYDGMKRDYLFHTYLSQLSKADVGKLSTDDEKLALLCNAYNAFVINGVITHKIESSVDDYTHDGKGFFDIKEHVLQGETISLNDLEHKGIRERFPEPRVHVALVCAAKSCPAIRAEAYEGSRIKKQLADQSKQFANNTTYVNYDAASNKLQLSPILSWYGQDFNVYDGGYLPWIANHVEDANLKQAVQQAAAGQIQVEFLTYDWSLNSQAPSKAAGGGGKKKKAEFGSGSIPNE